MENTAPDHEPFRMPDKMTLYSSTGKSFDLTEVEFQRMMGENKAKGEALIQAVDAYWKWLVESEPNKLTDEQAVEDFLSFILRYLVGERKLTHADITREPLI